MSQIVNKYGSSVFAVSISYRKLHENQYNLQTLYFILMEDTRDASHFVVCCNINIVPYIIDIGIFSKNR